MRIALATAARPFSAIAERCWPGLRILMYHRVARTPEFDQLVVSPERFTAQMKALAAGYRVVTLSEGLRALRTDEIAAPTVAVTFDDGYLDNLEQAAPILVRHGIPATLFVTTQFCDQVAVHPRYANGQGRAGAARVHLDWDQVRAFADLPGMEIGSHTVSHPYLQRVPDERAREEILDSRLRIERHLGRPVRYFCYPSGDFGPRELRLVRDARYEAAVSVAPGRNLPGADPWRLRRTEITERDDDRAFALKLSGAFDAMHGVLHLRRQRRFAREAAQSRNRPKP
jgi:peptidoglycan/xylan/chitin deacetylase (PgdA/CDA1 family)